MSQKADSDSDGSVAAPTKSKSKSESSEEVVSLRVVSQRPKQRVEVASLKEQTDPLFSDSDSDVDEYGIKRSPASQATRAVTFEKELDSLKQTSAEQEPNKLPPNVTGMFAGSKKNPQLPKTLPYKRRFKPDEQAAVDAAFKQANEALNLAQQQQAQQQAPQVQQPGAQAMSYTPMPQGTTMPQPEMLMRYQPTAPQVQGYQPTAPQAQGYQAPQVQGYQAPQVQGYQAPQVQGYQAPQVQGYQAPHVQGYQVPQATQAPSFASSASPEVAELAQQVRWLREQVLQLAEAMAELSVHRRSEFSEFQERYARAQRRLDRALNF